jgi:hypothetical protein
MNRRYARTEFALWFTPLLVVGTLVYAISEGWTRWQVIAALLVLVGVDVFLEVWRTR